MIEALFFSLFISYAVLLMGCLVYAVGYNEGERAGRKRAEADRLEITKGK